MDLAYAQTIPIPTSELSPGQALMFIGAGVAVVIIWLASRFKPQVMELSPKRTPDLMTYTQIELKTEDRELIRALTGKLDTIGETSDNLNQEIRGLSQATQQLANDIRYGGGRKGV